MVAEVTYLSSCHCRIRELKIRTVVGNLPSCRPWELRGTYIYVDGYVSNRIPLGLWLAKILLIKHLAGARRSAEAQV